MSDKSHVETQLFKGAGQALCIEGASLARIATPERGADFAAELSVGDASTKILGEIVSSGKPSRIRPAIEHLREYKVRHPDYLPVLVAPFLGPQSRSLCKAEGLGYIDLSGNCYVASEGVHIETLVERRTPSQPRAARDLFSDKASLVVRAMLHAPHTPWRVAELQRATGVSVSWVWEVLAGLVAAGYAVRKERATYLSRPQDLLQDWAESFNFSRRNDIYSYFCDAPTSQALIDRIGSVEVTEPNQYALTLHAGASLVAPFATFHEVYVYVAPFADPSETEQWWMETLDLEKVDTGGNLYLVWPYYKHGAFYRVREVNGLSVVSDIQLYIDLYNYPIRGREQAEYLMRKTLAHLDSARQL